jgi:hypothetical protein
MTEELKKISQEEIAKLPKESREAIASVDWTSLSEEIGQKYYSLQEEISALQAEVLMVLIGLKGPDLFVVRVENNVGGTQEEAVAASREVFQKIFVPISNKLEENIRKSGAVDTASWQKNIDFILSGGNFLVFLDQREGK